MKKPSRPPSGSSVSKVLIDLLNEVFEIEKKADRVDEKNSIERNVEKIKGLIRKETINGAEVFYENPLGEKYDETRTDCEASIAGESAENLIITEVIKPIIRLKKDGISHIEQKGVVIVESKGQ